MTNIEHLLLQLLAIPSPSGSEEKVANFVIKQLKGFTIKKQFIAPKRFNIIATKKGAKKWLVAHLDTIPGQLPIQTNATTIFGRGSCDNKQSVAASIIVGNHLPDVNLLFTVSEETDLSGARAAAAAKVVSGRLVVVQEPTQLKILTNQRGIVSMDLKTTGTERHSSLGTKDSALHKLMNILINLKKQNWTAFNIGVVNGGIADNVVAPTATAKVSARPHDLAEYKKIKNYLKKFKKEITRLNAIEPFLGHKTIVGGTAGFFSEMSFFKNSLVFGAGHIKFAHSDHEQISRQELNLLSNKLIKILEN